MNEWIDWFQRVLDVSIRLYFRQECDFKSSIDDHFFFWSFLDCNTYIPIDF